jgi:hypothetical protein
MPAPTGSPSPPSGPSTSVDDAPRPCPRCEGELMLVTVRVVQHPVSMLSCGECGYTRWRSQGEVVGLGVALDALRVPGKSASPLSDEGVPTLEPLIIRDGVQTERLGKSARAATSPEPSSRGIRGSANPM